MFLKKEKKVEQILNDASSYSKPRLFKAQKSNDKNISLESSHCTQLYNILKANSLAFQRVISAAELQLKKKKKKKK